MKILVTDGCLSPKLQVKVSPSVTDTCLNKVTAVGKKHPRDFRRPHHQEYITSCEAHQLSTLSYIVNEGE